MNNYYRQWTGADDKRLRIHYRNGMSEHRIAEEMGRSVKGVQYRLKKLLAGHRNNSVSRMPQLYNNGYNDRNTGKAPQTKRFTLREKCTYMAGWNDRDLELGCRVIQEGAA